MAIFTSEQISQILSPTTSAVSVDYTPSELIALQLGYVEVQDEKAFRGRYFLKDGKKWIHNLEGLRKTLNTNYGHYVTDEEMEAGLPEGFGYAVEDYYAYNSHSNNAHEATHNQAFSELMKHIHINRTR